METTGAKDKESHVPHTDLSNLTAEKFADPANHAPDPDEDDLDDLDGAFNGLYVGRES